MASLTALATSDASIPLPAEAQQTPPITQTIKGPQGAKAVTEKAMANDGYRENDRQESQPPIKEQTDGVAQGRHQ